MPNTCRYYTTASYRKLNRCGSINFYVEDKDTFNFMYCLINSSFTYWWWRIFDGGITYPIKLFSEMPVPLNLLSKEDKKFFEQMCNEMKSNELNYITKKVNAGAEQENIKFPEQYKNAINDRILKILGVEKESTIFDEIHSNIFFKKEDTINE